MMKTDDAMLLRVFLREGDKHNGLPLYEAIILKARELHMAGATIMRGAIGMGHSGAIHGAATLEIAVGLPIIVEIIDAGPDIDVFLATLDSMMTSGIVTLEQVKVKRAG